MVASEVRTAAIKILCDYHSSGTMDDIDLVATAAGSSVATGIINHPPPTNLGYHTDDPEKHLKFNAGSHVIKSGSPVG